MTSKMVGINLSRGKRVRLETPGGGGYGSPLEREPARVAEDVRLGYVSREAAHAAYTVVLDDAGAVDGEATARLRAQSGTIRSRG
jgi:N-methylhydantoinase B